MGATGPVPNLSEKLLKLIPDPAQPPAEGYVGGVRLGYACPYQGEPRRSGPRGRAVGLGVQLGPHCVAPRRLRRTREVSLPPARPLGCRRWQKGALGGAGRRPATTAAAALSPTYSSPLPPPLRRPLARTHAHDAATYAVILTPTATAAQAWRSKTRAADSTPHKRLALTAAPVCLCSFSSNEFATREGGRVGARASACLGNCSLRAHLVCWSCPVPLRTPRSRPS